MYFIEVPGFGLMSPFIAIIFFIVAGGFLYTICKALIQWGRNNASPVETTRAHVVAKRENVSHHMNHAGDNRAQSRSSTTYYVTFQLQNGERLEFHMKGREYGLLAEGDVGTLTYQGTRYLGFERMNTAP